MEESHAALGRLEAGLEVVPYRLAICEMERGGQKMGI